jgi:hypothetical protein
LFVVYEFVKIIDNLKKSLIDFTVG